MTKEELIKVFSAYLPYDLQIEFKRNIYPSKTEIQTLNLKNFDLWLNPAKRNSFEIKPILYDLSHLTKEIEHESKRFIPIEELAKIYINWNEFDYGLKVEAKLKRQFNLVIKWKVRNRDDDFYSDDLFIMTEKWNLNQYWVMQKLLEWHFNIFNLPSDQFINKATLNK